MSKEEDLGDTRNSRMSVYGGETIRFKDLQSLLDNLDDLPTASTSVTPLNFEKDDTVLALCKICNKRIPLTELEKHSTKCNFVTPEKSHDVKY
jgi:hypothetical protein